MVKCNGQKFPTKQIDKVPNKQSRKGKKRTGQNKTKQTIYMQVQNR